MLLKADYLPNAVGKQPSKPVIHLWRKWMLNWWWWLWWWWWENRTVDVESCCFQCWSRKAAQHRSWGLSSRGSVMFGVTSRLSSRFQVWNKLGSRYSITPLLYYMAVFDLWMQRYGGGNSNTTEEVSRFQCLFPNPNWLVWTGILPPKTRWCRFFH